MNYVYTLTSPRSGAMKTTRHVAGCPESQYGIEFEPTAQDLQDQPIDDCPCVPLVNQATAQGDDPPLPAAQRQGWPAGYRADEDEHHRRQAQHQQEKEPLEEADSELAPVESWRKAVLAYGGTFEFMLDMRKRAKDPSWTPTPKQLTAINKSLAREGQPPQQEESVAEGLDVSPLPNGRYLIESSENGGTYAFELSTGVGKWEGWRFVMGKARLVARPRLGALRGPFSRGPLEGTSNC